MQQKTKKKFTINFSKTLENLKAKLDTFRKVIPPTEEGGQTRIKEGVKQSVSDTVFQIYRLHCSEQKKRSKKPGSLALRTKTCSLARVFRCSERTVRRHLEKLIELGLIHAKARLGHGIQLVLNAAIVAFDELKIVIPPAPTSPPQAPPGNPSIAQNVASLAALMDAKFKRSSIPSPS